MTLRVDNAGRVILPKPLRDIPVRSVVELKETPAREERFVARTGQLPRGYDIMQALHADREDRDRKISGL